MSSKIVRQYVKLYTPYIDSNGLCVKKEIKTQLRLDSTDDDSTYQ